jgi:hypothetical protein
MVIHLPLPKRAVIDIARLRRSLLGNEIPCMAKTKFPAFVPREFGRKCLDSHRIWLLFSTRRHESTISLHNPC